MQKIIIKSNLFVVKNISNNQQGIFPMQKFKTISNDKKRYKTNLVLISSSSVADLIVSSKALYHFNCSSESSSGIINPNADIAKSLDAVSIRPARYTIF